MLFAVCATAACKKDVHDPDEDGKLRKISENLERAYARAPALPPLTEPEHFGERLAKWDDFRSCTVRTYVARKRDADKAAREGRVRPSRHASIGDETVEECAVQSAVANKDPNACKRLEIDFPGPDSAMPLSAVRCWDTRARVLGLPDECPVVWLADGLPGRNPECVALARRDRSLCPFADSPERCRALLLGDSASCSDAALDCPLALVYWSGLIPSIGIGPPLVDLSPPRDGGKALHASFDLRWKDRAHPSLHIEAATRNLGVSWPARKTRVAWSEDTAQMWGATLPPEAVQLAWREGKPAVKLAFVPGGATSGTRPIGPAGSKSLATALFVWTDPADFKRCLTDAQTKGEIRFDAGNGQPGAFVTGTAEAQAIPCSDGTTLDVSVKFRIVILDVR